MLSGVEIILARMKSNPEDFVYTQIGMSKWSKLVDHAFGSEMLTDEEATALKEGLKDTRREMFNQRVMQTLAGEDQQEGDTTTQSPSSLRIGTPLGGATQSYYQQAQLDMIRQQLEQYKATGSY